MVLVDERWKSEENRKCLSSWIRGALRLEFEHKNLMKGLQKFIEEQGEAVKFAAEPGTTVRARVNEQVVDEEQTMESGDDYSVYSWPPTQ